MVVPEIISLSKADIPVIVAEISSNLSQSGFPKAGQTNLEDFLTLLHSNPNYSTAAFVSERSKIGSEFHLYTLYSRDVNLKADSADMREVTEQWVEKFSWPMSKDHQYSTFFHIVAPQSSPTSE